MIYHQDQAFCIRKATLDDLDSLCRLEQAGSNRWKRKLFEEEFDHNFATILLVEHGTHACGFAVIWMFPGEIQLNNIAVDPLFRRRGVATLLLTMIRDTFNNDNTERIVLEVRESNTGARAFYNNWGFIESGYRKNYYGDESAVLMDYKLT